MNEKKTPAIRFQGFTDDWEQRKLGEVADVYDGVHQTPIYQDSGIMFLSVENISTLTSNKFISEEAFERDYKNYPEKGDILMTRIGDVGTPNVVETAEKVAFYVSLALLKPKDTDSFFLCNTIRSTGFQKGLRNRTLVTAIPQKINKDEIGKVEFQMPTNPDEPKKIGIYFKILDHLITLHQRKLTKLQLLKKSMLTKMFPKDGARVPEIRFQGFHKNWENLLFDDAVNISNDMVDPKAGSFDKLIHIGPGDIESHTGQLLPGIKTVSESHLISGKFRFYKGDIIYSKIRPELSKCVIAPTDGLASADAYILHCNKEMWQDFLYCILQTKHFYKYATSISMRTGMPKINREELGRYFFLAPSVKEQQLIGAFFTDLDHLISLHQRKLSKLQQIKQAMLSKLFV